MPIVKTQNLTRPSPGQTLLGLRRTRSMTQEAFAAHLGVPKSTFVAWERDEAEPPLRLAYAVRKAFGTRAAAELLGLLEEPDQLPRAVDWLTLGRLCAEVEKLAHRAGFDLEIPEVVEIAGIVFERGDEQFEQGLRDAEQLLRIGGRLRPSDG